jgi:hypothetical protein
MHPFRSVPKMTTPLNFDRSKWSVQTLGDFLAQQQECNEERVRGIYERDQISYRTQMDGINKRLEIITDLYNRTIENSLRAVSREEFEHSVEASRERLEETVNPMAKQLSEVGKPNWMVMVGLLSVMLVILSGCWLLIGLQINVAITPQSLSIEAVRTANNALQTSLIGLEARIRNNEVQITQSAAADAESRTDRTRLNQRTTLIEDNFSAHVAEGKANSAQFKAQLVEIETQFCASDSVRNLMHATDLRITSMLWGKVNPGQVLPTDNAFYPVICNRSAAMTNMVIQGGTR